MIRNVVNVCVIENKHFAIIQRNPGHDCKGCYFDRNNGCPIIPAIDRFGVACHHFPCTYRLLKDLDILNLKGKKVMFKKGKNLYDYTLIPIDEAKEQSK